VKCWCFIEVSFFGKIDVINKNKKMAKQKYYHNISWKEAVDELGSDIKNGLSEQEVKKRREKHGKNFLPKEKPLSKLKIFLEQFKSPLIYILVIAGLVTLFLGEYSDSIVIFAAVGVNTIVGFIQENKATQTLRKLKTVVKIKAEVKRQGNTKILDSKKLVPGDIIIVNAGDKVPADARIIKSKGLKINEMALTGEWLPAEKKEKSLPKDTPMADRTNTLYMGTIVEAGKATAVVTETGTTTKIGEVAQLVKETKEDKTPLQKKLARLAKIIGIIIVLVCFLIFIEGIVTGNSFLEMFTVAVAVAVAAIPEGLPVAMTVILAIGMQRILKKKGVVRKLLAAETLGSTSIVATDKTKTLTEGKMKATQVLTGEQLLKSGKGRGNPVSALTINALANEGFIENPNDPMKKWKVQGDPTDRALLQAAVDKGINKKELEEKYPEIDDIPFDAANKYIASLRRLDQNYNVLYLSGAPERILAVADYLKIGDKQKTLSNQDKIRIENTLEKMTSKGLRVVAVGYKKTSKEDKKKIIKQVKGKLVNVNGVTLVGFVGLEDPLREDVKGAIDTCRGAGMTPILVTGDHRLTAKAIAEEIGIKTNSDNIVEGKDLDKMSDEELDKRVEEIKIYARVEPAHKMRIIEAWQDKNEVVAMTGDGINDAPALKRADIGVALGSGTEVAKGTSDLILLNDKFSIIVAAVEEGRRIIDNIRKVITYLLSDSFSEIVLIGGALLFGFPLPISAVQILWVNLIEDGLPHISLAFEPKEKGIMKREPQDHNVPLLTREMKVIIFIIGLFTDLILLGLFFWLWGANHDITYVRTMIFAALSIDSLFYVFSCKTLDKNLWHVNPLSNNILNIAWVVGIIMLALALYLPVFQHLLDTVPIGFYDWLILLGLGIIELVSIEITKYYFITRHQTQI